MPNYIQQLRQPQVFGGYDPNQEMMDLYAPPMEEQYDPYQDMGPDMGGYQPQPIQQPQVQQPQGTNIADNYKRIMDAYTPETSARDRQNRLLDNYPGQYEPSTGDRWTAALMGLGERNRPNGDVLKVQNEILQGPRMRDIEDWKNQITPAGVASTNENQRNIQERQLLTSAIQADTQAAKLAETARNNDMKNEAAMIRARAYAYSQQLGKGWDWDLTGPTAKKFNKTTGEVIDTGLPTGKMDEQTKIELQNEGRVNAAREAGAAAMGRTVVGNMVPMQRPDGSIVWVTPPVPGAPSGGGAPQQGTPQGQPQGGQSLPPGSTPVGRNGPSQHNLNDQRNAQIVDYTALNPGTKKFFYQDPGTKIITMAAPPKEPNTGIIGNITGSSKTAWDQYYKDMEAYNAAKKRFFPNEPPAPIVGYDTPAPNGAAPSKGAPAVTPNSSKVGPTSTPARATPAELQTPSGASSKFNPNQVKALQTPAPVQPQQSGYAAPGQQAGMAKQQQDAGVASGQLLYAVDASGNIVGTVGNNAAGRAEAARLGLRVRGR